MNEKTKKYIRYGGIVLGIVAICATGWFLFRDIRSDGGTADSVGTELDSAAAEQQRATDTLESVQSGLNDSESTVGQLEQSNSAAQSTADGIAESNSNIKKSVGDAENANDRSAELLADSQRRISECLRIVQDIRNGTGKN